MSYDFIRRTALRARMERWDALFERADDYDVTVADVRDALAERRGDDDA